MKERFTPGAKRGDQSDSELKGVVKKMAGRLTSNPELEKEGHKEMMGDEKSTPSRPGTSPRHANPDPHRRG